MKREPYPQATEPTLDLRIDYFLANADRTRSLCKELGYSATEEGCQRPPPGKRGPQRPRPEVFDNVVAFPAPTPCLPPDPPPPLPTPCQEGNVPESDSGGASL